VSVAGGGLLALEVFNAGFFLVFFCWDFVLLLALEALSLCV
jgi:hypothetical protein